MLRESSILSIVFDARKHAEQSKRAREAIAGIPQSPDVATHSQGSQDTAPATPQTPLASKPKRRSGRAAAPVIGLRVQRRTADWHVRWNRNAAVLNATRGRLSIT